MIKIWNKINNLIFRHSWITTVASVLMSLSGFALGRDVSYLQETHSHLFILLNDYIIPYSWILLILSCLVFIYSSFIEYKNKPKINDLQSRLVKSEEKNKIISERLRDLFDGYLYNLSGILGFGSKDQNNERITLFIYDNNSSLIPFSRYSANPNYKKINRTSCPDNEGCIGKAWENNWHFDANFPCPENNSKEYESYTQKKYSIKKGDCKKLSMHSRLYAAHRIENNGNHLGVIVVEAASNDRFKEAFLKEILNNQNDFLSQIIKELNDYIPRPKTASSRGL